MEVKSGVPRDGVNRSWGYGKGRYVSVEPTLECQDEIRDKRTTEIREKIEDGPAFAPATHCSQI